MRDRNLLGMLDSAKKEKVDMRLSKVFDHSIDDTSRESIDNFLDIVDTIGDNVFKHVEQECQTMFDKINNDQDNVTGQDIATTMMLIDESMINIDKFITSAKLEYEAVDMSYQDKYHKEYQELYDGTVGDRKSYAESKTVKERYISFVRKSIYEALLSRKDGIVRMQKSFDRFLWNSIREH